MASPERVFIGLGSNLGDSRAHLACAVRAIRDLGVPLGMTTLAVSPLYRSVPWEAEGADYLNAVAVIEVPADPGRCSPVGLLEALQRIERQRGRQRSHRNAPRTLDLDIILYGQRIISLPNLEVPHPRGLQRRFVLEPIRDLEPALCWPGIGAEWLERLQQLDDPPLIRVQDESWPGVDPC